MSTLREGPRRTGSAVIVPERQTARDVVRSVAEPLTLVLALSFGALGALLGWLAHEPMLTPRAHATAAAWDYVEALCLRDVAYLDRNTSEAAGRMPWEPRLSAWAAPCNGARHLGSLVDRLGREQHVFTLMRPDGTEVIYVVTFGRDGLVAGVD